MSFYYDLIIRAIVVLFPFLMYVTISTLLIAENKKSISFLIFSIISFILGISFNNMFLITSCFLFISLMFLYLKGYFKTSLLMSLAILILNYRYNYLYLIVLFELITYLFIYLLLEKKIRGINLLKIFTFIRIISFSFMMFYSLYNDIEVSFIMVLYTSLIYYLSVIFVYTIIRESDSIICLKNVVLELEKEKNIKNYLFKVAHEVKNPIAVCKGYLDMLELNRDNTSKYLPIIKKEIERTMVLMSDYLDYSKIKLDFEVMDLNLLLEDVKDVLSCLIEGMNAKFTIQYLDGEEFILGDFNRLKQVFINLIKNSVESFDKDEKIVDVKIMDKNKYISVLISDNGCGMQKDELKQVGTMFYSTKDNGTGIGVSFSKDIIEKHHGKITYYSKYGKGTQVEVLLPKINI